VKLAFSSILLGFSWFAAVNLGATVIAWAIACAIGGRRCGAGVLLGVRLMPALVSSFFVAAMFLPAHWRFERADSDERFGVVLGALALLGLGLVGRSLLRAYSLLRTDMQLDARLTALTRQLGTPRGIAFEVTGLAGVSLAGILRPKILVGSRALAALTPAELEVAISHEVAHQRSLDNLKRFLICCAPDVFGWLPAARRLEQRWEAETECQADARAVRGDDSRAVTLASALVKVARLARPGAIDPSPAWSAFHVPTLLETRVRRLVDGYRPAPRTLALLWCALAAAAVALPVGAWTLNLSYTLHVVTEAMVTHLP
jgi:beta-lactamase regulating signal transducer with metallopeptidase domain